MARFADDLIASMKQAAAHARGRKVRDLRVAARTAKRRILIAQGSGNVFADLGRPNPEQELLKARLTLQIYRIVKARGLTQ